MKRSDAAGPAPCKVYFVGPYGVGKTTLLNQKTGRGNGAEPPTVGVLFEQVEVTVDGRSITLQCFDTGGMEAGGPLPTLYLKDANLLALCFDPTQGRWAETCQELLSDAESGTSEDNRPHVVAIATKKDTWREDMSEQALRATVKQKLKVQTFVATSAHHKINIDEAFMAIAQEGLVAVQRQHVSIFDSTLVKDGTEQDPGCAC
jgi:Ras-related protein Rab-7A